MSMSEKEIIYKGLCLVFIFSALFVVVSAVSINDIKLDSSCNPPICSNFTINDTCQRGLQGEQGINGTAATISIGNIYILPYNDEAYVTNTGNIWDAKLDFGIPAHITGVNGTYYVSDTYGGAATRKLTFSNGILISEV